MRALVLLALSSSTAHAEAVHPQLNLGRGRVGMAQLDGVTGVAVGVFGELGVRIGTLSAGIEIGIAGVCRDSENCDGPTDLSFALHARHRVTMLGPHRVWLGAGPAAHRVSSDVPVVARGMIARRETIRWQPGLDLLLALELRDRDGGGVIGGHIGLRAFALHSDAAAAMKPYGVRDTHGTDGGLVLEVGYVYGR